MTEQAVVHPQLCTVFPDQENHGERHKPLRPRGSRARGRTGRSEAKEGRGGARAEDLPCPGWGLRPQLGPLSAFLWAAVAGACAPSTSHNSHCHSRVQLTPARSSPRNVASGSTGRSDRGVGCRHVSSSAMPLLPSPQAVDQRSLGAPWMLNIRPGANPVGSEPPLLRSWWPVCPLSYQKHCPGTPRGPSSLDPVSHSLSSPLCCPGPAHLSPL